MRMSRTIDVGDRVRVVIVANVKETKRAIVTGTVLHVPQDTGDYWHVDSDEGAVIAFNPCCTMLEAIVKIGGNDGEKKES